MITHNDILNFDDIVPQMKNHGMKSPPNKIEISIPDSRGVLWNALKYFIGLEKKEAEWLPEYEEVAVWLSGNNGRGLFMFGNCGRGKSMLGRFIIPAILLKYQRKVVSVFDVNEMNKDIDIVLRKPLVSLDDIGTEDLSVKFGEKRLAFAEVIDNAEKTGSLLIVSTNLTGEGVKARYGDRIVDRIHSTMTQVMFNGKSLRK